jgi:hypothetical protein
VGKVWRTDLGETTDSSSSKPLQATKAVRCSFQNFKGPVADKEHQKKITKRREDRETKQAKGSSAGPSAPPSGDDSGETRSQGREAKIPTRMLRRLVFLFIDDIHDELRSQNNDLDIASDHKSFLVPTKAIHHRNIRGVWRIAFYDEDEYGPGSHSAQHDIEIKPFSSNDPLFVRELNAHVHQLRVPQTFQPSTHYPTGASVEIATSMLQNALNLIYSHRPNSHTRRTLTMNPSIGFVGANRFYPPNRPSYSPLVLKPIGRRGRGGGTLTTPPPWTVERYLHAIQGFFRSVRNAQGCQILLTLQILRYLKIALDRTSRQPPTSALRNSTTLP